MAEVIGLIASIIGILDGIDKSKTVIKKYIHTSASLRTELVPLLGKLRAFTGILRGIQLECELDESEDGRLQVFAYLREPLEASKKASQAVASRLNRVFSIGKISLTFGKILDTETQAALRVLDDSKAVLELALTADQRTLLKSIETYARSAAADLNHIREDLDELQLSEKAKARSALLSWVSQVKFSSNYHAAISLNCDDDSSGDWFLDGKTFKEWAFTSDCRGLLLTGISGGGKTVLCSKAIKQLQDGFCTTHKANIIYFFFDFNDAAKQSVEGMLRSLLSQLVAKLDEIPDDLQKLFSRHQNSASAIFPPDLQEWFDIFCSIALDLESIYIFIDALDECGDFEAYLLQETLGTLFEKTSLRTKWFITSRPAHRSVSVLQKKGFLHSLMDTAVIQNDIQAYLSLKLKRDPRLMSFGAAAKDLIVSEIRTKSAGMFRFAQCQLDVLAKLRDRRVTKVRDVLATMPKDISSMYMSILSDLQDTDDWPLVERVLALVSCCARPVTLAEVSEFVIIEDGMTEVSPEARFEDFDEILSLVGNLVTVHEGALMLAHKSVQDFLILLQQQNERHSPLATDLLHGDADVYIARRCMQYLTIPQKPVSEIIEPGKFRDPNSQHMMRLLKEYPLLDYAASRWPHHVEAKEIQLQLLPEMRAALSFTERPNLWRAWLLLQRIDIWETQLQLARLLCEASIRSSLVPGWADDFWNTRQRYRVTYPDKISNVESNLQATESGREGFRNSIHKVASDWKAAMKKVQTPREAGITELTSENDKSSVPANAKFYVKALYTRETLADVDLPFRMGDLIHITAVHNQDTWEGALAGRSGLVPAKLVERTSETPSGKLCGNHFYSLAVMLLEIALQKSLSPDLNVQWNTISYEKGLKPLFHHLEPLIQKAERIMGKMYGKILKEALANVKYSREMDAGNLYEMQDYAMGHFVVPLQLMLKSGFRASQSPVKGHRKQVQLAVRGGSAPHQAQSFSVSATYRATSSVTFERQTHSETNDQRFATTMIERKTASASSFTPMSQQYSSPISQQYASPSPIPEPDGRIISKQAQVTTKVNATSSPLSGQVITSQQTTVSVLDTIFELPADSIACQQDNVTESLNVEQPGIESETVETMSKGNLPKGDNIPRFILPILSNMQNWSPDLPVTFEQGLIALEKTRQIIVNSTDAEEQLAWSERVCLHLNSATIERIWVPGLQPPKLEGLRTRVNSLHQEAKAIIAFLSGQDHPKALFLTGYCQEFGLLEHSRNLTEAWLTYHSAFQQGSGRAVYRLAVMLEGAGDLEQARQYYERGIDMKDPPCFYGKGTMMFRECTDDSQECQEAAFLIEEAAELVDENAPEAAFTYGLLLAHQLPGKNVAQSVRPTHLHEARKYIERAAELGSAKAQAKMASAYELGELTCEANPTLSLNYNLLAASQGEADAEMAISRWLLVGAEGHFDSNEAGAFLFAWRAAQKGLPAAEFALGYFYEVGIHVRSNKRVAVEWYRKAAAKHLADAQSRTDSLREKEPCQA